MASYSALSPPSARLMMRWMLSFGTLLALALVMSAASLELDAGFAPPSLTATAISRPILVKTLARAPSVFSFLRLILFHLLCPDMRLVPLIFLYSFRLLGKSRQVPVKYYSTTARPFQAP